MLRGVIFDHDGTLVDTERQHYRVWQQLLQKFGHEFEEEEYRREHGGIPTIASAARLVKRFNLNLTAEAFCHMKQERVLQATEVPALMPGARELLLHLQEQGVPMAVATGARMVEVERNLRNHQLLPLFRTICSACEVEQNKPAPDVYLLAAQRIGLTPGECLAVEDTVTGMRAALAAGMACVVIPGAGTDLSPFHSATQVLPSLAALQQWLRDRLPKPFRIAAP